MSRLISLNLCSLFSIASVLFFWCNRSLHPSYLSHITIYLTLNPLLCLYLSDPSPSYWSRLGRAFCKVFLNFCTLVPVFIALIYFSCVHIQTLHWKLVLCHSLILSSLIILPTQSISLIHLIFGIGVKPSVSDFSLTDKFILINFLVVSLMSWVACFLYGLDQDIQFAHYPVASCVGALIGSLTTNFLSISYYLFCNYNTLGVY